MVVQAPQTGDQGADEVIFFVVTNYFSNHDLMVWQKMQKEPVPLLETIVSDCRYDQVWLGKGWFAWQAQTPQAQHSRLL